MPIALRYLDQDRIAHIVCEGEITLPDVNGIMTAYFSQPAPVRPEAVFIDLTGTSGIDLTFRGMLKVVNTLARGLSAILSHLRFVILAPDSQSYGLARQFQQIAGQVPWFEVSIHDACDDATASLGLDGEQLC